jgi:soluble lytic murein transglycosylase-like protein
MSRVRQNQRNWRTAATYDQQGSGCLSFYWFPPLAVLFFSTLIAFAVIRTPVITSSSYNKSNSSISPSTGIAPLFTPEVQYWNADILRWSNDLNLDANLVATVMQIESCGNPSARSSAGADGLFQVMPYHFDSTDNPFDPDTNALRGLTYLRRVFDTANQNISWSLAAYNGGPSLIGLSQWLGPAETVRYVYWGSAIYADAAQMKSTSRRLNEWLSAGGSSLCQRAHQQLGLR